MNVIVMPAIAEVLLARTGKGNSVTPSRMAAAPRKVLGIARKVDPCGAS